MIGGTARAHQVTAGSPSADTTGRVDAASEQATADDAVSVGGGQPRVADRCDGRFEQQ